MGNKPVTASEKHLQEIIKKSHFKKHEAMKIHKEFNKISSTGSVTRAQFVSLYNTVSTCYNSELLAEHMFRVFATQNNYTIAFEEFLRCLSVTTRGTLSEQIEWMFRSGCDNLHGSQENFQSAGKFC